jgi:glycerol-1-phosphate dehydrogenase [NAD(P)+]
MSSDPLALVLNGTYADPESGRPLGVPTRSVVIADSLKAIEAEVVKPLDLDGCFAVVSDRTTHEVLGRRVETALESIGRVRSIVLPPRPHADMETVARIQEAAAKADSLIAVGSGTINDLCKFAAAQDAKPYAVFATAPSMNGYAAENAAITQRGHKKSLQAAAPLGVFMDLEVLAQAPRRMIRSGFGDSLCRCTAQADWLLSHLLRGSGYRTVPFRLLADDEDDLLAEPEALLAGDLSAMARLARTLVLSGFGMTICGGSHPGSQGEHLISHYIDMMHPPGRPEVFHGEQVGVTTLVMARLQERILNGQTPRLRPRPASKPPILAHFGPEIGEDCWRECLGKQLDETAVERINGQLDRHWPALRDRLLAVTRTAAMLARTLERIGGPSTYEDIHLTRDFFHDAVLRAREIRNRFTFLDLAAETGQLEPDHLI